MAFNSLHFIIFFPVACLLFFLLPLRARWGWLLVASYYFYMSWNASYAVLILASTIVTYCSGLLIQRFAVRWQRKTVLALSFLVNLLILVFFKYGNFIIDNLNGLLGLFSSGRQCNHFDILLPVGISFYTFQALSYTMDVYRGQIRAETNFFRYALFVSFFPQLVAGPIERSANLLPQIWIEHKFDWMRVRNGLYLMAWGFFLKMVIADRLAIAVDAIFGNYASCPGLMIIIGTVMFGMQIYCDFNGYSQIAIGAAEVLGFSLMDNFRQPYFSQSVQEFWRRWHISLSTWFRDYLYIPLGGSRCGKARSCLNIAVTFLASGLWHGASWNYVAWGGLHGLYLIAGKLKKDLFVRGAKRSGTAGGSPSWSLHGIARIAITFFLVQFAWLFSGRPVAGRHSISCGAWGPPGPAASRHRIAAWALPRLHFSFSRQCCCSWWTRCMNADGESANGWARIIRAAPWEPCCSWHASSQYSFSAFGAMSTIPHLLSTSSSRSHENESQRDFLPLRGAACLRA